MATTEAQPSASNGAAMPSSPPPPSSLQARDLPSAVNSQELLDAHAARTGGKVCFVTASVSELPPIDEATRAVLYRSLYQWVVKYCRGYCLHRSAAAESVKRLSLCCGVWMDLLTLALLRRTMYAYVGLCWCYPLVSLCG